MYAHAVSKSAIIRGENKYFDSGAAVCITDGTPMIKWDMFIHPPSICWCCKHNMVWFLCRLTGTWMCSSHPTTQQKCENVQKL